MSPQQNLNCTLLRVKRWVVQVEEDLARDDYQNSRRNCLELGHIVTYNPVPAIEAFEQERLKQSAEFD